MKYSTHSNKNTERVQKKKTHAEKEVTKFYNDNVYGKRTRTEKYSKYLKE